MNQKGVPSILISIVLYLVPDTIIMSTTSNAASLKAVLKEKLNAYFNRLKKEQEERSVEKEMHVYKIRSTTQNSDSDFTLPAFSPEDTYWMERIQRAQFDGCNRRGILYRPKIVKEIMTTVDDENTQITNHHHGFIFILFSSDCLHPCYWWWYGHK